MNYGQALEYLKRGGTARRKAWRSGFVYLELGSRDQSKLFGRSRIEAVLDADLFEKGAKGTTTRLPNLNLKNADGTTMTGWQASQVDTLADDWELME
jgi:hypothetical protein